MFNISYDLREGTAQVDGERVSGVGRTREFALPGLAASAPDTHALYEEAVTSLAGAKVVWDIGAGTGSGARMLSGNFDEVYAIEPSETARRFAAKIADRAKVKETWDDAPDPDAAVIVDVLGHVGSPFAMLRGLRARLRSGARVFVAEALAAPLQTLKAPARRAFSRHAIKALATASGFAVSEWITFEGTFLACVLTAVDDTGAALLERAALAIGAGDHESALAAYAEAQFDPHKGIRREAALGEADLRLGRGEVELAWTAYLRAQSIDPSDARPKAALSQIACDAGEAAAALRMAEQAFTLDATDAGAVVALALAQTACGRPDVAHSAWRRACSLIPDQPVVASRYAKAALDAGDVTGALLVMERLREYKDSWPAEAYVAMAEVLLALGRKQDARADIKVAVSLSPTPAVMEIWKRANS